MVRTYPCHGYSQGSTPCRIVISKQLLIYYTFTITDMTQSINKPFKANEAAKQVEQLRKSFDAPAVKTVKQGLVPAPKAAKTSPAKKSGRVVGISADENK